MITSIAQRWRERRASYRPAGEVIDTRQYDVSLIVSDDVARRFVCAHHYSGTFPAALARVGLYRRGDLVGVLVASQPMHANVTKCLPVPADARAELGRLVLLDDVAGNGESWFCARAFDLLHREHGFDGLVSFSDPIPRTRADGGVVLKGHYGGVYQASNARFIGRSSAGTLRLLPDGTTFSKRAWSKVRGRECGWEYAASTLVKHGAAPLRADQDQRAWLNTWLPRVTRRLRHPGNFKYLFGLSRSARRAIARDDTLPVLSYPKLAAPTAEGSAS